MERRQFVKGIVWSGGIAAAAGINLAMWRLRTAPKKELVSRMEPLGSPDRHVSAIAFGLNGNQLVSVSADRKINIWDTKTEKIVLTRPSPHPGGAVGVSLYNANGWLAAVSDDSYLSIWNSVAESPEAKLHRLLGKPTAVAFAPMLGGFLGNCHRLAVALEDRSIQIFERSGTSSSTASLNIPFSGCCGPETASNRQEFQETRVLQQKYGCAKSLLFSQNGNKLVATVEGNYLQTWSIEHDWSQGVISSDVRSPLNVAAFNPDGNFLAAGAEDGTIVVWDWQSQTQISRLRGHGSAVTDLAFFGNENWLMLSYADGVTKIWTRTKDSEGMVVDTTPGKQVALSRSADGQQLASAWGSNVKFWNTKTLIAAGRKKPV